MRCLALARRLLSCGAEVQFVSRELPGHRFAAIEAAGCKLLRLPAGLDDAQDAGACLDALPDQTLDWIVVDHYALDASWEKALRARARAIAVIDDLADRDHDCDLLLDQNLFPDADSRYRNRIPAECVTLLGPRHALLREEFAAARAHLQPRGGEVKRVFVSFGGADAENHTGRTQRALRMLEPVAGDVVIGALHPARSDIEKECAAVGHECHVDSPRMAELMARADFAIGAGGSTTWERCCLGLPALAMSIAANQEPVLRHAAEQGLLYPASADAASENLAATLRGLWARPAELAQMARRGLETVDGQGVARVSRAMGIGTVKLRRATPADSGTVFEWRNHESVRTMSRDPRAIDAGQHAEWYGKVLADPARVLLIGEQSGQGMGVVRFDLADDRSEISIYLAPGSTGRGLGPELLCSAESWLRREFPRVRCVEAQVLGHNVASRKMFESAGYRQHAAGYIKRFN
jgi:UDP-2,4-diacetamido-2,4,6-trideoxy-beta-L-altropyranose hydrolase